MGLFSGLFEDWRPNNIKGVFFSAPKFTATEIRIKRKWGTYNITYAHLSNIITSETKLSTWVYSKKITYMCSFKLWRRLIKQIFKLSGHFDLDIPSEPHSYLCSHCAICISTKYNLITPRCNRLVDSTMTPHTYTMYNALSTRSWNQRRPTPAGQSLYTSRMQIHVYTY